MLIKNCSAAYRFVTLFLKGQTQGTGFEFDNFTSILKTKLHTSIKIFLQTSVWLTLLIHSSCSQQASLVSPVPDVNVREQFNLNSIEALPLKARDGNFVYIPGGIKGIIIYRRSTDNYIAFERKSPYKMEDTCGRISVHSSQLYMEDICHSCTFNWEGRPTGGPCSYIMKMYQVQFINNFTLLITNP